MFLISLNLEGQEFEQVSAALSYMWRRQRSLESVQGAGGLDGRIRGSCVHTSGALDERAGGRAQLGSVCLRVCLPGRAVLLSRKYKQGLLCPRQSMTRHEPQSVGQGRPSLRSPEFSVGISLSFGGITTNLWPSLIY